MRLENNSHKAFAMALHYLSERTLREIRPVIYQHIISKSPFEIEAFPFVSNEIWQEVELVERECLGSGIKIVTCFCEDYPRQLLEIADWPGALFCKGTIARKPRIAIVGSRNATQYGLRIACELSQRLTEAGIEVVSGLAFGIDSAAHEGALRGAYASGNGAGIAVLACGLDQTYPAKHYDLLCRLIDNRGLGVTEYPPGVRPRDYFFLRRNRIISGLCQAVVVVEAKDRSGALATARHALEQGRDVFAVPGRIDSLQSEGTNKLIEQGAIPLTSHRTVLDYLDQQGIALTESHVTKADIKPVVATLDGLKKRIFNLIEDSPRNFDTLLAIVNSSPEELMVAVCSLEIAGLIRVDSMGVFFKTV